MKSKTAPYNARIYVTPTGQLRLGHLFGCYPHKEGGYIWKDAPEKVRKQIAKSMGAKLLPRK